MNKKKMASIPQSKENAVATKLVAELFTKYTDEEQELIMDMPHIKMTDIDEKTCGFLHLLSENETIQKSIKEGACWLEFLIRAKYIDIPRYRGKINDKHSYNIRGVEYVLNKNQHNIYKHCYTHYKAKPFLISEVLEDLELDPKHLSDYFKHRKDFLDIMFKKAVSDKVGYYRLNLPQYELPEL